MSDGQQIELQARQRPLKLTDGITSSMASWQGCRMEWMVGASAPPRVCEHKGWGALFRRR
jgi:hypothetical protein